MGCPTSSRIVIFAIVLLNTLPSLHCAYSKKNNADLQPYIARPRYYGKREYEEIKREANDDVTTNNGGMDSESSEELAKKQIWGRRHRYQMARPKSHFFKKQEPEVVRVYKSAFFRKPIHAERFFGKRESDAPFKFRSNYNERFGKRENAGPMKSMYSERFGKRELRPRFSGMNRRPQTQKRETDDVSMFGTDKESVRNIIEELDSPTIRIGDQETSDDMMKKSDDMSKRDEQATWGRFGKQSIDVMIVKNNEQ